MKTPYTMYEEALYKFLECQEPVKVTKTYTNPGFDMWDSPSELFEATGDGDDDGEDMGDEDDTTNEEDVAADDTTEEDTASDDEATYDDVAAADDSGAADDGTDVADDGSDDMVDLDDEFGDLDDTTGTDVDIAADDINSDPEPSSVSAKQLLSELTEGDDNIYTRVAAAAKEKVSGNEITVEKLLPIIALAIKKFMKNKNYASLSKAAMKGLVMNIAKTMAHPPKKEDDSDNNEEA